MENYSKPGGQNVDILNSIINKTEYSEEPRSQISELLLELKEVIESGGGTSAETAALLIDNAAKNLLLLTLDKIKEANEGGGGTWNDNVYTEDTIAFTVNSDEAGRGTGVTVSQTAGAASASLTLIPVDVEIIDDEPVMIYDPKYPAGDYIFTVGTELPDGVDLAITYEGASGTMMQYVHDEAEITLAEGSGCLVEIYVRSNSGSGDPVIFNDFTVKPMLRRADTSAGFEVGYMTQKQLDAAVRKLQAAGEISSYSETELWSNPNIASTPIPSGSITLNSPLSDYKVLYVVSEIFFGVGVKPLYVPCIIPVSQLVLGRQYIWAYKSENMYDINYVDNTHVTLGGAVEQGANGITAFEKIIGIKY